MWENGSLRVRDIHLFNEKFPSVYEKQKATSNECSFFTLPVVDGYIWSSDQQMAGLRFKAIIDGKETLLEGDDPVITSQTTGKLHISWPLKTINGTLIIDMDERRIKIKTKSGKTIQWFMDMSVAAKAKLPFVKITHKQIACRFQNMDYFVKAITGSFDKSDSGNAFKINPEKDVLTLDLSSIVGGE